MILGAGNTAQPNISNANATELIFDVDAHNFEQRVMMASMNVPVLVDFWAPWCGPCKQLMPVLEKVVRAANGQVLLAKVNLDNNPELAQALRVQSVPTVFGFFQGQPVEAFMGVQPESKLNEFINKLIALAKGALPDALDIPAALKEAAEFLNNNDPASAQALYAQILEQDEQSAEAYVGIIRTFIATNQVEHAINMIDTAPDVIAKSPIFEQGRTAVELAQIKPDTPIDKIRAKIDADTNDHAARIDLAYALFAAGKKEEATDALLDSIALDRGWNDEAARKELLTLFHAMGHTDPITLSARKKLSSILFS